MKIGIAFVRSPGQSKHWCRIVLRFQRNQNGATAVEFALVAVPFLALLFAIIELAMMFWTTQILEESLSQTARSLLTGQSQTRYASGSATANRDAFKNDLCTNAGFPLIDCSKLFVDVRTYTTFGTASTGTSGSDPVSGGAMNTAGFTYSQPQAGQIVVVRAALEYSLFFTQWSQALASIGSGKRGIVATTAFKAEPFAPPAPPRP